MSRTQLVVALCLAGTALVVFFVPVWILVLGLAGWAYWRSHRVRREVRSLVEKVERTIPHQTPKPADPSK